MATIDDVLAHEDPTAFSIALSDLVCERCYDHGFEALQPAERVAFCVDTLEREVNNGGFSQFFTNSSGDTALETLEALQTIGAPQAAELLRQALAVFPGSRPSRDRDERTEFIDALDDATQARLGDLDGRFYEYPDDLTALMRKYVQANRSGFRPWP